MTKFLVIVSLAVMAACGPSSAELKTARETTYTAPPATLFAAAKDGLAALHYDIRETDEGNLRLETQPIWFTPQGQIDTTTGENIARLQEDSIHLTYVVQLAKATGDAYRLTVVPLIGRKHGLTSVPDNVAREDPSLPGWVEGKTTALEVNLHDRLKQYATPTTNGTMPAAAPAPAPVAPAPAPAPAAPDPATAPATTP